MFEPTIILEQLYQNRFNFETPMISLEKPWFPVDWNRRPPLRVVMATSPRGATNREGCAWAVLPGLGTNIAGKSGKFPDFLRKRWEAHEYMLMPIYVLYNTYTYIHVHLHIHTVYRYIHIHTVYIYVIICICTYILYNNMYMYVYVCMHLFL